MFLRNYSLQKIGQRSGSAAKHIYLFKNPKVANPFGRQCGDCGVWVCGSAKNTCGVAELMQEAAGLHDKLIDKHIFEALHLRQVSAQGYYNGAN
jgi:hypothetical protein